MYHEIEPEQVVRLQEAQWERHYERACRIRRRRPCRGHRRRIPELIATFGTRPEREARRIWAEIREDKGEVRYNGRFDLDTDLVAA